MNLLGVLNLSEDSFSDGGRYAELPAALEHARALADAGASCVDVGAVSSNPDSGTVDPAVEIGRLEPVIEGLDAMGIPVSVDTFAPDTQRWAAPRVAMLNDIRGFPDPSVWPVLAEASCKLVVMHQVQDGRADRRQTDAGAVLDGVFRFFEARIAQLTGAGVDPARLVLDPGMGFFLGADPAPSVAVLRAIPRLREAFGLPVLIGLSRKSFLGTLLGGRAPLERGPATLAAELYAVEQGADWIRTHDVGALADALAIRAHLRGL